MGLFISQEIKEEKTKNQELKGLCFMKLLTEVVCAPKKIKRQAHTKDNFRIHSKSQWSKDYEDKGRYTGEPRSNRRQEERSLGGRFSIR